MEQLFVGVLFESIKTTLVQLECMAKSFCRAAL